MAPGFQTSFIPKTPITQDVFKPQKTGFLGIIAILVFISSILAAAGMVVYKNIVKSEITDLQAQLAEAERKIDKEAIKKITQFSKKLSFAKAIVFKHQVISGFLDSLASSTVATVSFTDFNYNNLTENNLSISMKGRANDYTSLAVQEAVFLKNKYWKSVIFSNLNLAEAGYVTFDLLVTVDPEISVYSPPVAAGATAQSDLNITIPDMTKDLKDLDDLSKEINNL